MKMWKRFLILNGVALVVLCAGISAAAQNAPAPAEKGPGVGRAIPEFRLRDQFGREQTFASLAGRRGLVLLFYRSADW